LSQDTVTQDVVEVVVDDPGIGRRLDVEACTWLGEQLRGVRRRSGVLLVTVHGDAWHQDPDAELPGMDWSARNVAHQFQSLARQLFALDRPVVVRAEGAVSGFGLGLAMAADLRSANSASTWSVGRPASALLGATSWLVTRAVGSARFAQLAWTGTTLTAEQALTAGLVTEVDDVPDAGQALAGRLASLPTAATSALKRAMTSPERVDLDITLGYQSWLAGVAAGALPDEP
jgi:enoyl-CoA hydratase/carnithine racemase